MSYIEKMYIYLVDNSDKYNYETIEYTKSLVERIETQKGAIYDFFIENDISFDKFLDEAMTLAEYRLKEYGKADLTRNDFEEVLDFLIIEIDTENLISSGHVESFMMEEDDDSRIFIPDQFAVDFYKDKYNIELEVNKPFDYDLFYKDVDPNEEMLLDLISNVCLN